MRRVAFGAVTAVVAAVVASCNENPGPVDPSTQLPSAVQLSQGPAGKVTICHAAGTASDPRYGPIKVSNTSVSTHFDDRGTPRAGHEQDYFVTERTPCPPPSTPGQVSVCKVGEGGVPAGTAFTVVINGVTETVLAGQCVTRLYRVGTQVTVTEAASTQTWLSGLTLLPAVAGTTDLTARSARLVVGTDVSTVTFTNTSTTLGVIVICKVAGEGISVGTPFSFGVHDINFGGSIAVSDLPAGAGPGGTCSAPVAWEPVWDDAADYGKAAVLETVPLGVALTGISVSPAANVISTDLSQSQVLVTVVPGQTTTVTFTNTSNVGSIVVCKVAGAGITVGTPFSFGLHDVNFGGSIPISDLPAGVGPTGTCSSPVRWEPVWDEAADYGKAAVLETVPLGTALTSISVSPAANEISTDLSQSQVQVKVVPNQTTTVTFTNANKVGSISVCKVAGSGISVGTPFSFSLKDVDFGGEIPVNGVTAGAGPAGTCSSPVRWEPVWNFVGDYSQADVIEGFQAGVTLTGISVSPAENLISTNLSQLSVRVKVVPDQTTTVTFTNTSSQ